MHPLQKLAVVVVAKSYFELAHSPHTVFSTMQLPTQVTQSVIKPIQEILLDSMQCVAWGKGGNSPTAETSSSAVAIILLACSQLTYSQWHTDIQV